MKIEIACTIDNNYVSHCGIMLKSLFFNNKGNMIKINIFHNGIIHDKLNELKNFVINHGHEFHSIQIDETKIENAPVTQHVTLATYYRVLMPEFLDKDLDKILFLDSDLIIRKNILELWDTDLTESFVGACLEYVDDKYKARLGLTIGSEYFNAGVLLINLKKWREENVTNNLLDYIKTNSEKLLSWDQDALNVVLHNKWKKLDIKWNIGQNFYRDFNLNQYYSLTMQLFNELKMDPSILHFTGSEKPWNYFNTHPLKQEYLFYKSISPWKKDKLVGEPDKEKINFTVMLAGKKILKKIFYKIIYRG
jgi:lipopolysaccharide biosynthesis glycosyltransferase